MEKTNEWHNVVVAVTPNSGLRVLVCGDPELCKWMDGDLFDDNSLMVSLKTFPDEPGVYIGTIEYWFQQGYSDGYPADGESDFDYRFVNWELVAIPQTSTALTASGGE